MKTPKTLRTGVVTLLILSLLLSGCDIFSELPWNQSTTSLNSARYGHGNEYGCAFIRWDGTVTSTGFDDGITSEMNTWRNVKQLALTYDGCSVYGLLENGTVEISGNPSLERKETISEWTNVNELLSLGPDYYSLDSLIMPGALTKSGRFLLPYTPSEEFRAFSMRNLCQIDTDMHRYAVTTDGNVVCNNPDKLTDLAYMETLSNVNKITDNNDTEWGYFALMEDGTIEYPYDFSTYPDIPEDRLQELTNFKKSIESWTDIEDIYSPFPETLIGIGKDHTVKMEFCSPAFKECFFFEPESWTDIHQFRYSDSQRDRFFGIKGDGNVVYAYLKSETGLDLGLMLKPLDDWENIIALDYSENHVVGLKNDGTAVATGLNDVGQCDVTTWHDIISIVAGPAYTAGLQSDGTIVIAGQFEEIGE